MSNQPPPEEIEKLLSEVLISAPQPDEFGNLYITAASLQFRMHFRAAHLLLNSGFDAEAWILVRSMTELLIRAKWVKRNKSNAAWIIVGTELKELNRFKSQKTRSILGAAAIQSIQQRLDELKPKLPRNARCWSRNASREFAALPSTEAMARECGLLKVYRTWFKLASDHTHSSHKVLERFIVGDGKGNFKHLILDPNPRDLAATRYYLNCIAVGFMGLLVKSGWPIDKLRLQKIDAALVENASGKTF